MLTKNAISSHFLQKDGVEFMQVNEMCLKICPILQISYIYEIQLLPGEFNTKLQIPLSPPHQKNKRERGGGGGGLGRNEQWISLLRTSETGTPP